MATKKKKTVKAVGKKAAKKAVSRGLDIGKTVRLFDGYCEAGLCYGITNHEGGEDVRFCVEAAIDLASRGVSREEVVEKTNPYDEDGNCREDEDYSSPEELASDQPTCVDRGISSAKIELNDSDDWRDEDERAETLRAVAILQLGTNKIKNAYARFEKLAVEYLKGKLEKEFLNGVPVDAGWREFLNGAPDIDALEQLEAAGDDVLGLAQLFDDYHIDSPEYFCPNYIAAITLAYEYALSQMNTPGYQWLVKHEKYKAPTI